MADPKVHNLAQDTLHFRNADRGFLEAHLPEKGRKVGESRLPFTTLTFATSLES